LLLIHLGMSGSLQFSDDLPPGGLHDHFDLVTTAGTLRLHDPRRFGAVVLTKGQTSATAIKLLGRLGVEPLEDAFHGKHLSRDPEDPQRSHQAGVVGR
jgi:formamidopyrimidine-DNA glycosylase